ncbi:MAG: CHRD domain-containing protein [Acidobacteria bacterium]|nr:CHRD domain-containing protein [Acidobacteriota bacterium]
MKKIAMLCAIGAILALGASGVQAQDQVVTVRASLEGSQENPGILTGAFGSAVFTLNRTTQQITYTVNIFNLPSGITGAHIHVGPRGQNGPIIFPLSWIPNVSNDFALTGTLTSNDLVLRQAVGIGSLEDAFWSISAGVTYVNVHTQVNPGGEIRGQICPSSADANIFIRVATCVG